RPRSSSRRGNSTLRLPATHEVLRRAPSTAFSGKRGPFHAWRLGEGALVHLLDLGGVRGLDCPPLDLERRGQLATLHCEVTRQDGELLDGLPAVEPLVELRHVLGDQLLRLG